ncbi:sulfatase family protein [Alienimonas californiensis]|uniref:Arylsulfatase n=1 Tax=Alienimonas californiensis TaxID=2527989 RepID=A0A517P7G8_9PLAN|nr:sulfatase [Alienimonas californiensis]QDT15312.1 Arylsulfatase [Alienimonas californiensis]
MPRPAVFVALLFAACLSVPPARAAEEAGSSESRPPNVVIVFCDDMGYGDAGFSGATDIATPHLDALAKGGMVFTDFYAAQAVCSASRAALLTGCYPNRLGISGAFGPNSNVGLNPDELTIAELCKQQDYATAIYGKWHLGDHPSLLPTEQGFDEWFGLPYSNDMWPLHPAYAKFGKAQADRKQGFPPLPLYETPLEGENAGVPQVKIAAVDKPDQALLTTWNAEHAVDFIDRNADKPFFLYVPHSMPHVPIFVSDKFAGKSGRGLYGDVIMEIDWSVGQIVAALEKHGLRENTLIVFTSDNGPWLSYGTHSGDAGPFREGKGTTWEGGQREPTLFNMPGTIPAGTVCEAPCGAIDLLPTVADLIGEDLRAALGDDRVIDGESILPLLKGETKESPHEALLFYWGRELQAIRSGDWKLHFPHEYRSLLSAGGRHGTPSEYVQERTDGGLYNLRRNKAETKDVAKDHPDVVARLEKLADAARQSLGDSRTKAQGNEVRPIGRVK